MQDHTPNKDSFMVSPPRSVQQREEDSNDPEMSLVAALQTSFQQERSSSFFDGNQTAAIPFSISDGSPQRSTFDVLGEALDFLADDSFFQRDGSPEITAERIVDKKKHTGPPRQ
ncbi:unnamed protein product [Cylindrotheca closterium]|uniref:Uncharacterized protein n=1 Tax=Cylindrotheca closterium TaxID=2856 RepID=A0AAD2FNC2_9STRA|nr:unnamed protein product [Cylindrotheca closterium]